MQEHQAVPHEKGLDHTLSLVKEGYHFIPNRMAHFHSDIVETRLMGKRAICITGKDAIELFYNPANITREKAAPGYVKKTLFGMNTVHGMEGEKHTKRRSLFLSIATEEETKRLSKIYRTYLNKSLPSWEFHEPVVIYNEIKKALAASVCEWAGVPILEDQIKNKADQLMAMVFGFGTVIAIHEEGKAARKVMEEWMEKVMEDVRSGFIEVPDDSPIRTVCEYKEEDGKPLDPHMAAVEMLNIIRPPVATSIYVAFAARALHDYPQYKEKLRTSGEDYLYMFCEEVRRFYPLAPFVGGKAARDFTWKECEFKQGDMVLLDIYGINHSEEIWENPMTFDPEHFKELESDSKKLIAQGAGDMKKGHRCPGEAMVRRLLMDSVEFLAKTIEYELVPGQDIDYDLTKIPTIPKSGIEIYKIRRRVEEEKEGGSR